MLGRPQFLGLMLVSFSMISPLRADSLRLSKIFDTPPVFERAFGDPKVVFTTSEGDKTTVTRIGPKGPIIFVTHPTSSTRKQAEDALATHLLRSTYQRFLSPDSLNLNEKRLNIREIIPMSEERFLKIGLSELRGISANGIEHTWWQVRMGEDLEPSKTHQLIFINLLWADADKKAWGHFAFGIREIGGNAQDDFIADFRAPWHLDRRPRFTEGPNIHNRLKLGALTENLYDWLYTQTEYRNSDVHIDFHPISVEQEKLLRAFKGQRLEAGNFRVFKKNCASLGLQMMDLIRPADQSLGYDHALFHIPAQVKQRGQKAFSPKIGSLILPSVTRDHGREPSSKSKLYPALPSRSGSAVYRQLRAITPAN
ncbi:MAG: hypothetical protein AAF226_14950 [Verrucomicrobiota bacterium]